MASKRALTDAVFQGPMLDTLVEFSKDSKIGVKQARFMMVCLFKVAYRAGVCDGVGKKEAMVGGGREAAVRSKILGHQAHLIEESIG